MLVWHTEEALPLPLIQICNIIRVIKDNGGITFLTADNKNRVIVGIYNDGVYNVELIVRRMNKEL